MIAASPLSLDVLEYKQKKNVLKEPGDVWEKEKLGSEFISETWWIWKKKGESHEIAY